MILFFVLNFLSAVTGILCSRKVFDFGAYEDGCFYLVDTGDVFPATGDRQTFEQNQAVQGQRYDIIRKNSGFGPSIRQWCAY